METKDILLLVVGAVISLIINYISQYTSNPLSSKFREWRNQQAQKKAKQSVTKAKKRIEKIENELAQVKGFVEQPVTLSAYAYRVIQLDIIMLIVPIIIGFLAVVFYIESKYIVIFFLINTVGFFFYIFSVIRAYPDSPRIFMSIHKLPEYEKNMREQLADLQKVVDEKE